MGEYNDTIREHGKLVEKLTNLTQIYQSAICRGISAVNVTEEEDFTHKENLKELYHEKCEEYIKELNNLRITGKGEIYYKEELYHTKDSIASMIKQHLEILEHISEELFKECEWLFEAGREYSDFLNAFVKYRKYNIR